MLSDHFVGAETSIVLPTCILFVLSLAVVFSGVIPPFTEDTARAVSLSVIGCIVGIVETPGKLTKEIDQIKKGFVCGRHKVVDFVNFSVKYGCLTFDETEGRWNEYDIPTLDVVNDTDGDKRITQVAIDTKRSIRWFLAINTEEIEDFMFKVDSEEVVPADGKSSVDGWHIIQVSGGTNAPTRFDLTLFWVKNSTQQSHKNQGQEEEQRPLLKLRTDLDELTPKAESVFKKLLSWCSLFGKSTSPRTLSFLSSLPVNF